MKPLETLEYIILAALVSVVPWSWELATKLFAVLFVTAVARAIATRHLGNPALSAPMRWALVLMVGYYLWNGVSLLWTDDLPSGLDFMETRLPLLLLPLMLLGTDTSYLSLRRRRGLLYLFCVSMVLKFLFLIIKCISTRTSFGSLPLVDNVHYTYTSLYLLMALGFLFIEWTRRRHDMPRMLKNSIPFAAVALVLYTLLSTSRTGIIGLIVFLVYIVIRLVVSRRNFRLALLILLGGLALGIGIHYALPENARRVTMTLQNLKSSGDGDARVDIYRCSLRAGIDNMPLGTGVGDGQQVLNRYYTRAGHDWDNFNSHNIYLDALLTLGIPGLLLLLAMLVLPVVDASRSKNPELLMLLICFLFVGLFESVISRQMGLMFIAPMLYITASTPSKNGERRCEM